MENISNRTSHELYHGRVNSILKMGPCAYGPIKAINPLPKGLDVHTNGSNLDCVVATTSISLLFLHPRCDSPPLFGVFHQNGNATNSKGILYFAKFSTYACGSP